MITVGNVAHTLTLLVGASGGSGVVGSPRGCVRAARPTGRAAARQVTLGRVKDLRNDRVDLTVRLRSDDLAIRVIRARRPHAGAGAFGAILAQILHATKLARFVGLDDVFQNATAAHFGGVLLRHVGRVAIVRGEVVRGARRSCLALGIAGSVDGDNAKRRVVETFSRAIGVPRGQLRAATGWRGAALFNAVALLRDQVIVALNELDATRVRVVEPVLHVPVFVLAILHALDVLAPVASVAPCEAPQELVQDRGGRAWRQAIELRVAAQGIPDVVNVEQVGALVLAVRGTTRGQAGLDPCQQGRLVGRRRRDSKSCKRDYELHG